MDYHKTVILPTDDKKLAQRIFREFIQEQPYVLLVVLGKGEQAERSVDLGSKLSGATAEPRHVVWARKPEQVVGVIADLTNGNKVLQGQGADATLKSDVLAFSISMDDDVCDVVKTGEELDFLRFLRAYMEAEA